MEINNKPDNYLNIYPLNIITQSSKKLVSKVIADLTPKIVNSYILDILLPHNNSRMIYHHIYLLFVLNQL